MLSFVVVRVQDEERLKNLLKQLENLALPYNICSEGNLRAPANSETSASANTGSEPADSSDVVRPTVTAEVMVSGEEIDITTLLGPHCSGGEAATMKPSNGAWSEPSNCEGLVVRADGSWALPSASAIEGSRRRVRNNIKRYRRQLCKICGSFNLVPFLRSKMTHAAIHSDFKRYKCPYCDKRGVSVGTITLHIKSRHPGKPHNEYFDEMNEEEYVKLLLLTERCFDNPYM
ncbi:C2H2-type domain-containing protein [Trichostrongylus colubriformis]|uniref:C2H2-type domain-containing protein n=1 Tax=Trichostrongylus colubriformis TaxID=6319 RepID=A0AAN8F6W0_TRICO